MVTSNAQLRTLAHKWLNRLAPLLLLLAVVWLCWNIARIVWLFLAPPQAPDLPNLPIKMSQNTQKIQANAQSFNIFETPNSNQKQIITNKSTASNISLKGVMTASPLSKSSALISINNQIKNYRVGKLLEGTNYTLESVNWNEISLRDTQNNLTTIKMNEPLELNQESNAFSTKGDKRNTSNHTKAKSRTSNNSANSSTNNRTNSTSNKKNNTVSDNNTQRKQTGNTTKKNNNTNSTNKTKSTQKTIQEIKKNPAKYLSKMGVQASNEGYLVTNAMPASIRNKAGLKAGDRILSLNGQKVGSNPTADTQLLEQVQKSGKASIQVKRGERIFTFNSNF